MAPSEIASRTPERENDHLTIFDDSVCCGYVYRYTDLADGIVKYIGQTQHLFTRIKTHARETQFGIRRWKIEYLPIIKTLDLEDIPNSDSRVRQLLLDVEYLFIEHFKTMKYLNSERTPVRKNASKYRYYLDKEFSFLTSEFGKGDYDGYNSWIYRNLQFDLAEKLASELRMASHFILEFDNKVDEVKRDAQMTHDTELIWREKTIELEKENRELKEKLDTLMKAFQKIAS